jgi:hypothetical protein
LGDKRKGIAAGKVSLQRVNEKQFYARHRKTNTKIMKIPS